jgi:hypothetical protein
MRWIRSLLLILIAGSPVLAADSPQWLGRNRDGASTDQHRVTHRLLEPGQEGRGNGGGRLHQ